MTDSVSPDKRPSSIYVWLVPSEEVLDQPGSWRIRKWDTEPFPEATHTASSSLACREILEEIASVLDKHLGDTDLTHFESEDDIKEHAPLQWACSKLNEILASPAATEREQEGAAFRFDPLFSSPLASSAMARTTYEPLTKEEIEQRNKQLLAAHSEPWAAGTRRAINVLCDMAASSLLYAEEIQRLRDTPSAKRIYQFSENDITTATLARQMKRPIVVLTIAVDSILGPEN